MTYCARARPDIDGALAAHPRLAAALDVFGAGAERHVVVLPGTRDAKLAFDEHAIDAVAVRGWVLALGCVLEIDTGGGTRVVRIEPGHRLDPAAAFADPRDPHDHPLSVHLERDVLPMLATGVIPGGAAGWLEGVEDADPAEMGSLVTSRFAYRRLFQRAMWLTLPVLALLAVFFPFAVFSAARRNTLPYVFRLLAAGFAIELLLVGIALAFVIVQLRDALRSVSWWARDARSNDAARGEAVGFVTSGGAGLITAHTRRAELTDLGAGGFYANCGPAGRVVEQRPTPAWDSRSYTRHDCVALGSSSSPVPICMQSCCTGCANCPNTHCSSGSRPNGSGRCGRPKKSRAIREQSPGPQSATSLRTGAARAVSARWRSRSRACSTLPRR